MSGINLNSISENASRLGMRLQEQFSEHTRDLPFARGSSALYLDASEDKIKNIRKQLDSNSDREKLDAMKRLIALISKGRNVSEYFAQVVKNVASQNLEIRKLVYIYLLRYAEQEPDLTLLSINTFQRDLTDSSPLIRAMALRVLSGIKVQMIGSIVVLAIKKCAADMSPYVRKAAAIAIPKCYDLDSSHTPALIDIIKSLLQDPSYLSIGSVAVAFQAVCPTRLDLLHSRYRRLCKILVDVDEWGQIDLMILLLRYARTMLPKPISNRDGELWAEDVDEDIDLLLRSTEPLLQSRNPGVIVAVVQLFIHLQVPSRMSKIVQPLLRLLHTSPEVERVVLTYLLLVSQILIPGLLGSSYTRFSIRSCDARVVKQTKIKLLLAVTSMDNYQPVLRELIDCSEDTDEVVADEAIQGIGRMSHLVSDSISQCMSALVAMIESKYDNIVGSAVTVLKQLIQTIYQSSVIPTKDSAQSSSSIVCNLAQRIDDIKNAEARACVVWLVGQYSITSEDDGSRFSGLADWAPDVLRKTVRSFQAEANAVKLQIITLAAKLLILCPSETILVLLARHAFNLARYDLSYDVRDRCRVLHSLLAGVTDLSEDDATERGGVVLRREQVRLVLFDGKARVVDNIRYQSEAIDSIGTLSFVTGRPMPMGSILSDWLEEGIDPALRDTAEFTSTLALPQITAISSSPITAVAKANRSGSSTLAPAVNDAPKQLLVEDLDTFYAEEEQEELTGDGSDSEESTGDSDDSEGSTTNESSGTDSDSSKSS